MECKCKRRGTVMQRNSKEMLHKCFFNTNAAECKCKYKGRSTQTEWELFMTATVVGSSRTLWHRRHELLALALPRSLKAVSTGSTAASRVSCPCWASSGTCVSAPVASSMTDCSFVSSLSKALAWGDASSLRMSYNCSVFSTADRPV